MDYIENSTSGSCGNICMSVSTHHHRIMQGLVVAVSINFRILHEIELSVSGKINLTVAILLSTYEPK